ncbi:MAG: purine-binding chemotaxis protein CheW [Fischerella sp.]|jgi:twitching motility protein PilI|uniref:chemotaxis protein CheW n=1 Tax=Fischerella sp. TaxID=1191 RepID=UPI0017E724E6|nr:chemotaxis protein CheW [Fischerella sp.]NWF59194.1 purine-binding chemotaxis protein CheW [Fischerella sp.]
MDSPNTKIFINQNPNKLGDGYLKFKLNQSTSAVLPIRHTQEVMIVPVESIASMPNMPACVLGLMNWRSRIIWVIDLPNMLNLESINNRSLQYNLIIIHIKSVLLGIVVPEIKGIIRLISDIIQSPHSQISHSLVPYLSGLIWQDTEILLVLDAQAIVQSQIFHNNY